MAWRARASTRAERKNARTCIKSKLRTQTTSIAPRAGAHFDIGVSVGMFAFGNNSHKRKHVSVWFLSCAARGTRRSLRGRQMLRDEDWMVR